MVIHKIIFKDLPDDKVVELIQLLNKIDGNHDLEIFETDDDEFDELTKQLYKEMKKAKAKFSERIFKLKHKIK